MRNKVIAMVIVQAILVIGLLGTQARLPMPSGQEAREKIEKAEKSLKKKEPDRALVLLREVMAAEPNYAPAYFLSALACRMKEDHEQALTLLEKALQLDPGLAPAINEEANLLNALAQEMVAQNQPEKGYDYYARIAALPGLQGFNKRLYIEALFNMGISAFQAKKHDQSEAAFRRMLAVPNVDSEAPANYLMSQYMMGINLNILNRAEESVSYFQRYLELSGSEEVTAYTALASYFMARYEFVLLEAEVKTLKENSADTDPRRRMREIAEGRQRIPKLLQTAISGRPDLEDAYVILSNYYYYAGDLERAMTSCRRLIEKFPDSSSAANYQAFLNKIQEEKEGRQP